MATVSDVRDLLAVAVGVEAALLDADRGFASQGIGANALSRFAQAIEHRYGRQPPNLLWECNSLAALTRWIASAAAPGAPAVARQLGFVAGLPDPVFYE